MPAVTHAMSSGAQAWCYGIALLFLLVAAFVAWVLAPRQYWPTLVAVALALCVFVLFVNAIKT